MEQSKETYLVVSLCREVVNYLARVLWTFKYRTFCMIVQWCLFGREALFPGIHPVYKDILSIEITDLNPNPSPPCLC